MRALRIAPAASLPWIAGRAGPAAERWDRLPEQARLRVLVLLAAG